MLLSTVGESVSSKRTNSLTRSAVSVPPRGLPPKDGPRFLDETRLATAPDLAAGTGAGTAGELASAPDFASLESPASPVVGPEGLAFVSLQALNSARGLELSEPGRVGTGTSDVSTTMRASVSPGRCPLNPSAPSPSCRILGGRTTTRFLP